MGSRARRQQHSKGKKRPGHWHQGAGLARQQDAAFVELSVAEDRGVRTDAELAEQRRAVADDAKVWAKLDQVAPFVPRLEAAL